MVGEFTIHWQSGAGMNRAGKKEGGATALSAAPRSTIALDYNPAGYFIICINPTPSHVVQPSFGT